MDPNLDPELALALRVSMEEERARQTAVNAASTEGAGTSGTPAANDGEAAAGRVSTAAESWRAHAVHDGCAGDRTLAAHGQEATTAAQAWLQSRGIVVTA